MHKFIKTVAFCTCALFSVWAAAQEIESGAADAQAVSEMAPVAEGAASETETTTETTAPTGETAGADASSVGNNAENGDANVLTEAALDKQLHDVSSNLDTLKEDTFATKSRLLLLREEILQRSISGSHLLVHHKDDIGGQYELTQIYYAVDRTPIFVKQDDNGLDLDEEEVIYDEIIASGAHQLSVLYVFKGKKWGIFTYMSDYTFRVESGYDFIVDEGKAAELTIIASEEGDAFTAYEDRPTVKYDFQQGEYDFLKNLKSADDADSETTANTESDK